MMMAPSASIPSFSYYELGSTSGLYDDADDLVVVSRTTTRRWRRRSWPRFRRWRRPRVRVAGLIRRLVRRKARVVKDAVRFSVGKVIRRLKEGKPYFGDLFAGNYMFMQVSPAPATMGSSSLEYIKTFHHLLPTPTSSSSSPRLSRVVS